MKIAAVGIAGITAVAALAMLPAGSRALPDAPERTHLGDLICDVGRASKESASEEGMTIPAIKQDILCVIHNRKTGVEETYRGDFRTAGNVGSIPQKSTLLWEVSVSPDTKLSAGLLDQSYEMQPSSTNKALVKVAGESKPGVSLRLVTDQSDDKVALPVLSLKLELVSSSA